MKFCIVYLSYLLGLWLYSSVEGASLSPATDNAADICVPNPCQNQGTCFSVDTFFGSHANCACEDGFTGIMCEIVDPMSLHFAGSGDGTEGVIEAKLNTIIEKLDGLTNRVEKLENTQADTRQQMMEIEDPCPCENGGLCFEDDEGSASQQCYCPFGFTGNLCETEAPSEELGSSFYEIEEGSVGPRQIF